MFDELPLELQQNIIGFLPISGIYRSLFISTQKTVFFSKVINSRKPLYDLLHAVVQGEHDKVEALLKENIDLLIRRDQVTDKSGRTFEDISAFEYALWALDKHMWTLMLQCLPKDKDCRKIVEELLAQYNKVNTEGVTYLFNEETNTEKHFNFQNTIIQELQTQVDSVNASGDKDWNAIDKQWCEGVGGAQKLLPMHVVDEYCSDELFFPVTPKFTSQQKSSKQFYNWTANKDEDWFNAVQLGSKYAVFKGGLGACASVGSTGPELFTQEKRDVAADFDAMKTLCEVRTLDFINLRPQLEEQASLDNHHLVTPPM